MSELVTDFIKEFSAHMDRGDYYENQDNYEKALQEYAKALSKLSLAISIDENGTKHSYYISLFIETDETKKRGLFTLIVVCRKLISCYNHQGEYYKANTLMTEFRKILTCLDQYTNRFDPDEIRAYENLLKTIKMVDATIQLGMLQESIQKESDPTVEKLFQDLQRNLESICSQEICSLRIVSNTHKAQSGGDCFIATAAYSTANHPDLTTFREFRDTKLLVSKSGKWLVSLYYKIGPWLAELILASPALKKFLRRKLETLARWIRDRKITSK